MARHSRTSRSGSSWSPVLILLCLLICPLALLGHANAQGDDQEPLGSESSRQDLGDVIGIDLGTTYSCVGGMYFRTHYLLFNTTSESQEMSRERLLSRRVSKLAMILSHKKY